MIHPRAADDFAMVCARMKELRRERERAEAAQSELPSDPPARPARIGYWSQREVELRRDRCDDLGRREWGDQLTP